MEFAFILFQLDNIKGDNSVSPELSQVLSDSVPVLSQHSSPAWVGFSIKYCLPCLPDVPRESVP